MRVLPVTLAADAGHVVFHDGRALSAWIATRASSYGTPSRGVARSEKIFSFYAPTLVLYDDVVLFSGGETAGLQTGSWYERAKTPDRPLDRQRQGPLEGLPSAQRVSIARGSAGGRRVGLDGRDDQRPGEGRFTGRDPQTGEVKSEFTPDVETYWFHHRCYRGKATDNYLLMARAGTEFVDVAEEHWIPHHWVRGACSLRRDAGQRPDLRPTASVRMLPGSQAERLQRPGSGPQSGKRKAAPTNPRSQRGPAYGDPLLPLSALDSPFSDDWPTYRHDAARSGRLEHLGARVTRSRLANQARREAQQPGDRREQGVFVASVDTHTVYAMDAGSGEQLWHYTTGARIDSPPTIYRGRVLFGSADGWVYCLRAADGQLAWRFRAAPSDERMTAFEQVESVWPVPGNVLVQDGVAYCVAGRSMFLDGGCA